MRMCRFFLVLTHPVVSFSWLNKVLRSLERWCHMKYFQEEGTSMMDRDMELEGTSRENLSKRLEVKDTNMDVEEQLSKRMRVEDTDMDMEKEKPSKSRRCRIQIRRIHI
jgi:hypothetical protein